MDHFLNCFGVISLSIGLIGSKFLESRALLILNFPPPID